MEAPSIIPPVAKVEILYDRQNNINNNDATSSTEKVPGDSTPISYAEPQGARAQLLLESRITPFRTVQRRLLPKRAAKDPVMNEWLYYTRSSPTSHAIFAPELTPTNNHDDIQTTTKTLPFYYPKVRGFRYGYIADPEEAPEDRDDHHHDNDQGESGSQGQDLDYEYEQDAAATGEKDSAQDPTRERKSDIRRTGQRLGWITLDLFLAGDENVFTDKVVITTSLFLLSIWIAGSSMSPGMNRAAQTTHTHKIHWSFSNIPSRNCSENCSSGASTLRKGSPRVGCNTTSWSLRNCTYGLMLG